MTKTPDSSPANSHHAYGEKEAGIISTMFDRLAPRYDLANDVLSFGQVRLWRRRVVDALAIQPGEQILDIACGTGTSTAEFSGRGAEVIGVDFSAGMLEKARILHPGIEFHQGDATALAWPDHTFDAVTCSFGLRNVKKPEAALAEMRRVLKPGGRVVIAEFSHPDHGVFGTAYDYYLRYVLPRFARLVASTSEEYAYLMESILTWPDQLGLASMLHQAGFTHVEFQNLTGGIVAIHKAFA